MIFFRIIVHITLLFLFYAIGSWVQQSLGLVIPGSIIGMLLLFLCFSMKIIKPSYIEKGTTLLLSHMPLLFLPITTGIIVYLDLFTGSAFFLLLIAFVSTLIMMAVSGYFSEWVMRREQHE